MCDKKWDEDSELIRISEAALGRGSAWATSIHPPPPTGGAAMVRPAASESRRAKRN